MLRSNAPNATGAESGLTPPPIPLGGMRSQPAESEDKREEDGEGGRVEEHGAYCTQFFTTISTTHEFLQKVLEHLIMRHALPFVEFAYARLNVGFHLKVVSH